MKEGDTISEYFARVMVVVIMRNLGEEMSEAKRVEMIVKTLVEEFTFVVCGIEESNVIKDHDVKVEGRWNSSGGREAKGEEDTKWSAGYVFDEKKRKWERSEEEMKEKSKKICPPGGEDRMVIYTMSLRGVRRTFEACNAVRSAVESFGVVVCERDVSMDRGFRDELVSLMGKRVKDDGEEALSESKKMEMEIESKKDELWKKVRSVLHAVQLELANVKNAMGRREEAIENLKKSMEIKEMTFDEDSKEMGVANRSLADAYVAVLNFNEALPYALKALEIHKKELGNNSAEVAQDRRLLGVIYSGLEQHDEALEQNRLSQRVLKNWGMKLELIRAEIDAANMKVALGKYEEAIDILKSVVQQTDKESEMRAMVFISMSKALVNQQKFADSKRCLEFACEILEKKETALPVEVAEAYSEIRSTRDKEKKRSGEVGVLRNGGSSSKPVKFEIFNKLRILYKPGVTWNAGTRRLNWMLLLAFPV